MSWGYVSSNERRRRFNTHCLAMPTGLRKALLMGLLRVDLKMMGDDCMMND